MEYSNTEPSGTTINIHAITSMKIKLLNWFHEYVKLIPAFEWHVFDYNTHQQNQNEYNWLENYNWNYK